VKRGIGLKYALKGLLHATRAERNMRIHAAAAVGAIALGVYGRITPAEWLWVLLAIALVIGAEAVNTAIERVVDLTVGTAREPLAGQAKDAAAGAVLVLAAFSLVVLGVILVPAVLARWNGA